MIKKFTKTIGHEKQKELFLKAFEKGQLGQSYALVGPKGIGKTTFVRDFAEILGAHPILDLFIYEDEKFTIEQARDLKTNLRLKSSSGGYRVAVVSNAEKMSLSSANSLLKVLEEPPANSIIFLITDNYHNLLPTITSRVQKVQFSKLDDSEMTEFLKNKVSGNLVDTINFSNGCPGAAVAMMENPELLGFYKQASEIYEVLENGSLADRMIASNTVSKFEASQIQDFITFVMGEWSKKSTTHDLGQRISRAFSDLKTNLNTKLLLDNLFIT